MKTQACLLLTALLAAAPLQAKPPVESFIAEYAGKHDFNGSILVQKGEAILYAGSFGLASRELDVRNTNHTKYKIASITKAFTAVLVLQLQEAGKLDLNATVDTYLPDYSGEGAHRVTLHQLLNHTSGIDNFDQVKSAEEAIEKGIPAYQMPHSTDELISKYCSGKLVNAPGKAFSYNNADYIILGRIIERLSGTSFEQTLRERILEPLGMRDTGMLQQRNVVTGLASTYFMRPDLKALAPDLPVYPENWFAAGAMYSTIADLLKFSNALFGARLLKEASLKAMLTPGLDDYGYGLWTYQTDVGGKKYRVVKRPGQIMGAQTQLYRFLDVPVTVIILSNTGTTDLDEFVAEIGKRVVD